MSDLPVVGITMGDPSGVGPEIIIKALSGSDIFKICRPLVLGDPSALFMNIEESTKMTIKEVSCPSDIEGKLGQINLLALSRLDNDLLQPGKPTVEGGKAMVDYIIRAVEMARLGEISAMVTCPISKILMHQAGYDFNGHTQMLAHLTNTDDYVMMLAGSRLRVVPVTTHCAFKEVLANLDENKILKAIFITSDALNKDFGIKRPRLAVAAINPHAGEEGLFGSEEIKIIKPAIEKARSEGIEVEGPLAADTLFYRAASGEFDAVVAMYHDQGLIPLKLLHFSDAVNITLGLPIIRTSVDHGTAYDIAGKGIADSSSLKAAITMAVKMAENRTKRRTRT